MSDIYYCSNNKKKSEKMPSAEKGTKSTGTNTNHHNNHNVNNNNNNNNNVSSRDSNNICGKHSNGKTNWNTKVIPTNATSHTNGHVPSQKTFHNTRCTRHHKPHQHHSHGRKSESVLSTDSDIRFTRRKIGDSQKCGCVVISGFLVALLVAGAFVYIGYTYFRPEPLPDRIFRGKFRVTNDKWSMDLADQMSIRFQHKARDYRERINLLLRRSDLREPFEGTEILALDGTDDTNDILVHFNVIFDPYIGLVSTADLLAIFTEEIIAQDRKYFANMTVDPESLTIKEVTGLIEEPIMSSSPLEKDDESPVLITTTPRPPRTCEPLKLSYCRAIGYNSTTYPNLLGHTSIADVEADVIAFREMVDAECFREAFDFVCRLLQPPCETNGPLEPTPGVMCREYCQIFMKGCGNRVLHKFKKYFDCETFPESTGMQSCHQKPRCSEDLQSNALSPRLCDGIGDCPDLSDERSCSFCPPNSLYCGRGRACISKKARCDGKADCPDGSDEKDCLSIAPLASALIKPEPLVPFQPKFHSEGFAVFSEKGTIGKLCAEGLDGGEKVTVRQTVAESLCKSLGYESVHLFDIRNDTENLKDYVRVLDPHAPEISFIRTTCQNKRVLYVSCGELQCGIQSVLSPKHTSLPKMSSPGDWPWLVALYREDTHVCDGTLVSRDWVLTTESCFQGQPRATWMAIFGSVRLNANAPWTQRRRVIGLIKSPVEGSTAALIRLETPVAFSDFVRPVCLPDELDKKLRPDYQRRNLAPKAEKLESSHQPRDISAKAQLSTKEMQQFFVAPSLEKPVLSTDTSNIDSSEEVGSKVRRAVEPNPFGSYPLPESVPQMQYYSQKARSLGQQKLPVTFVTTTKPTEQTQWTNCNTLGWSRQRDHLQRVQLKISDMSACENVSIATVNSMCTEATFQKHDCTQEEFSGAPVQCTLPGTNQWALVGISSWRIACGPTGVERPRMYDKITSNAAWIRDTINSE